MKRADDYDEVTREGGGSSDGLGEDGARLGEYGSEAVLEHVGDADWGGDDEGRARAGRTVGAGSIRPATGWQYGRSVACFQCAASQSCFAAP